MPQHFVNIRLEGDYPIPTLSAVWKRYRNDAAGAWELIYQERIQRPKAQLSSVINGHRNGNPNPAAGESPIFIDASTLRSVLPYRSLINHLQTSLPSATSVIQSPIRHHHQTSSSSTLLLMPAWSLSPTTIPYTGVKLVTVNPNNSALNLPGVHASYVLFNSVTGQTLASIDGTELTVRRTACISAVASHYLSNVNSQEIGIANMKIEVCEDIELGVRMADIVSCATSSETPVVMGRWLKAGAHLDLVGSYKPTMRECDDEAVMRGRVFVDGEAAVVEAGELVGAFERGVLKKDEIEGIWFS
ncbi:hypothetical protein E3N88_12714 [Mikania micrantha]|uniref:Uncharacterized protein n=1 Tax=Mikania micrantha TaxID=192012 RepID=A0A5N6P6B2_9ASTR|nr:hypothetical protein E3N88_12714 [Mikania micrantha]